MMAILTGMKWYLIVGFEVLSQLATLNIFLCVSWPSVCLWRNVYLGLLPIFWLGCLFSWDWASWTVCEFWRSVPCQLHHLQIFSSLLWVAFLFIVFFAVQKLLSLIRSHLFLFVFYFHYSRRWVIEDLAVIYVIRVFCLCFPLRVL